MNLKFPLSNTQIVLMAALLQQEFDLIDDGKSPVEVVLSEEDAEILIANPASMFKGEYGSYPVVVAKVSNSHIRYIDSEDGDIEQVDVPKIAVNYN